MAASSTSGSSALIDETAQEPKGNGRQRYGSDHWQTELAGFMAQSSMAAHFVATRERFLYANPGFEHLTGYCGSELLTINPGVFFPHEMAFPAAQVPEESFRALPPEEGTAEESPNGLRQSQSESFSSRGRETPYKTYETRITTRNGTQKWVSSTTATIEYRGAPAVVGTVLDITEYKEREEALRRSEMRYRKVFEFAPDEFVIYNPEGTVIDVNPHAIKIHGYDSREEMVNRLSPMNAWSEEDRARFMEIREQTLKYGEWRGEARGCNKDGQIIEFEGRVKVADIAGETVVISIARDIGERKRMEEQIRNALKEKEMLLREIHHRVKNNMQIISTLLKLQLGNAGDDRTRALFRESQNRILSMAMIHEKLYQSEGLHRIDLNDYITDLAGEVFASFGEDSDRIALRQDVEDISLGMDTAIPCGLIVIELLSNALKYAFPGGRTGEIFIGFRSIDSNRFELTVSDNGTGLSPDVDISRLKSLGLRLISDLAKYQLEGEMDVQRQPGTTVQVRFHERSKPASSM